MEGKKSKKTRGAIYALAAISMAGLIMITIGYVTPSWLVKVKHNMTLSLWDVPLICNPKVHLDLSTKEDETDTICIEWEKIVGLCATLLFFFLIGTVFCLLMLCPFNEDVHKHNMAIGGVIAFTISAIEQIYVLIVFTSFTSNMDFYEPWWSWGWSFYLATIVPPLTLVLGLLLGYVSHTHRGYPDDDVKNVERFQHYYT